MNNILNSIGNTPMCYVPLDKSFGFYAKLEGMNPFGSMKDRAAYYILRHQIENGTIYKTTDIIESSSGNFGIALSATGKILGHKVICVIDPKIIDINKKIMKLYGADLRLVTEVDANGTYQASRIRYVQNYLLNHPNTYWTNQYNNQLIIKSYFQLAEEIIKQIPFLTHIYIPISTCGTIAGISTYFKNINKDIKIIAVDVEGSKIFNKSSAIHCNFPGMGSGVIPKNLEYAKIDDVIIVSDNDCSINCRYLLEQGILCGASSGGVTAAIKKNLLNHSVNDVIVGIFPDRGERYISNLYDDDWCKEKLICSYRRLNTHTTILCFNYTIIR